MSALTETEINIRKQTLNAELEQYKSALNDLETKKANITAQVYAVQGALQPVSYTHLTLPTSDLV